MTWRADLWGGCEAAKVAPFVVPYLQGRCLDVGSGPGKVWPKLIGVDIAQDSGRPVTDICADGTDLSLFRDETFDGVFSSFLLTELPREKAPAILTEWARVLKDDGYLVLYLPHGIPDEAEPAPIWQPAEGDIRQMLNDGIGAYWTCVIDEIRDAGDEYGNLLVFRKDGTSKVPSRRKSYVTDQRWERNPEGKKRAVVVRYGAIGDAIVAASILPGLKAQGYHVTFNCKPSTKAVLLHDPHIDEWFVQEDNYVPNEMLGPYWAALETRYDRVVNLCESVEGLLLTLPGRLNHAYPDATRRRLYSDVNYLEHTHDIANVPHDFNARFYASAAEMERARWDYRKMGAPVVVWTVNGSSAHKVWPWVHIVVSWLLKRTPAHVVLYADPGPVGKALSGGIVNCLEQDGSDMTRVHNVVGQWDIRRSLAFAHVVDCVVGPETGPLNAVGMADVPKVIYLSHSSAANLTKHWVNTTSLEPDTSKAPCYPCHRLHYTWEHCTQDTSTGAAMCASSISPQRVFEAIALTVGGVRKAA